MLQDIKILISMQKFDDQIGEKDIIKKNLPHQLDTLHKNLSSAEENLKEVKQELEENLKTQKANELKIASNKTTMGKYEDQLLSIKTNKEYKALNSEIAHLKTINSQVDDEIIELMEAENKLREKVKEATAGKDKAKKELANNEDKLKKQIDEVEDEIQDITNKRNSIAKTLNKALIKRYVMLIKNKNRKAIAFMEQNACTGCGFKVRPQLSIEVSKGSKIISCENCGRILVEPPVKES